ncbi:MAG TPA: substrate-binding domain-containing protein [Armatimonadota bacterium]|jgi:phosphate transport system substrate-binding protein
MKKLIATIASIVVFASIAGAASASDNLSGTLSLSGAWAIYPLAVKWGETFQKQHPNVKLDISAGGAGKGMADALSGAVDIGMVSREIDKAERAKGAFPIFIAKDGVFATISSNNPADRQILKSGITKQKLLGIFINGTITNWKQVGGPSAPIHAYTRSDACGAGSAWAATLGKYKQDNLKGVGVYGDPGLLEAVRRDSLGIGYNNLGYVFSGDKIAKGVYLVPIDVNHNGKADADEFIDTREKAYKAISSGAYPGARREFFVTNGKPSKLARAFIEFALSETGTRILEDVGGYVPLSGSERTDQIQKIQ